MDVQELQELTISEEEIDEIYDQGREAVKTLVFSLVDSMNTLTSIVKEQDLRLKSQEKRINDLENQINKNSRNSSKPPSSDSPFKINNNKKKGKLGNKKKRPGTTLKQTDTPDETITHEVHVCKHCLCDLSGVDPKGIDKRQIFDIPPIEVFVTEHQGEIKECPHCHGITKASFPGGVTQKAQYGPRIQAVAVYLRNYQLIPLERAMELFRDLFKVSISEGSLVNMTSRCADRLLDFMAMVKENLKSANVIHNDETGINVGGVLHWMHTAGNQNYTYLFPHKKRGSEAFDDMGILTDFKGVSVHDFWRPYEGYGCSHAYCNAHLLRELTFVYENMGQKWADRMIRLMLKIKEDVDASDKGFLEKDTAHLFIAKYRKIIKQGYAVNPQPKKTGKRGRLKKGTALCLIERLDTHQDEILRFMNKQEVPFDNNLAERDLRMVKVRQKISGTFRNLNRAGDYCRIRSYISTLRKQGSDVFTALVDTFEPDFQKKLLSYS